MVVVDGSRFLWRKRLVFFPTEQQVEEILAGISCNEIVSVRQCARPLARTSGRIDQEVFGTSWLDLRKDLEALYAEMDSKSCRYEIRKAEKLRERIRVSRNDSTTREDFLRLYNRFVELHGHTRRLSRRRLEDYCKTSDIWVLYLGGRPMAGHLLVRDVANRRVRLIFSATARLNSKQEAGVCGALNRLLHWEEMQAYKAEGMETYDFGGIGDGTSSVARFKLSFGGQKVEEYSYVFAGPISAPCYRAYLWLGPAARTTSTLVHRIF